MEKILLTIAIVAAIEFLGYGFFASLFGLIGLVR